MNFPRRRGLTEQELEDVASPITPTEIHEAIKSMSPYKAPGNDGLQAIFYQANWDIVGAKVVDFALNAFKDGYFDEKLNETLLCVIPKVERPETINQFRPISLCNVVVKLIAKIMVARIRPIMCRMIPPTQTSFIPGRGCNDNVLVVQEAIHSMKKRKGKNGYFMMKVDLEKAYDRLNWDFVKWVLQDVGLPENWVALIMWCLTTSKLAILWNGEKLEPFQPQRGVKQGDPLSPYMFVLCLDKLAQMIEREVQQGNWKTFGITRGGPFLSHLFFADDLIFFGKASQQNTQCIMNVLKDFCSMSGQKINPQKSKIMFSPKTATGNREAICSATGMSETDELGKYLGVPLNTKRVTKATFKELITRVNSKLSHWKANNLSLAGRRVLVQSVSSTMASHVMQSIKLPKGVSNAIDQANRTFLWGGTHESRKTPLVKWDTVCLPRDYGGLGLRKTEDANQALLAKLGWKMVQKEESLWVDVMRKKYLGNKSFLEAVAKPEDSPNWKSILSTKEVLQEGMGKIVHNGETTYFWLDKWIGDEPLALASLDMIDPLELEKSVADYWSIDGWDWSYLGNLLPPAKLQELSQITLISEAEDTFVWRTSPDKGFTTLSAYETILTMAGKQKQGSWNNIWELKAPPKIQTFLWLILHNKLLTNCTRVSRRMAQNDTCPRCGRAAEDVIHLLRDCTHSQIFWSRWLRGNIRRHWNTGSQQEWVLQNLKRRNTRMDYNLPWNVVFAITCWNIWLDRNRFVFREHDRDLEGRLQTLELQLIEAASMSIPKEIFQPRREIMVRWQKPSREFVKLNVDGSARLAAGTSAAGGVCRDDEGRWLFGFSTRLGNNSAHSAELQAVSYGLTTAWEEGYRKIILESDSELVTSALNNMNRNIASEGALMEQCRELLNREWTCEVHHVYREANKCADYLASLSTRIGDGFHLFRNVPHEIKGLYEEDLLGYAQPRNIRL